MVIFYLFSTRTIFPVCTFSKTFHVFSLVKMPFVFSLEINLKRVELPEVLLQLVSIFAIM